MYVCKWVDVWVVDVDLSLLWRQALLEINMRDKYLFTVRKTNIR